MIRRSAVLALAACAVAAAPAAAQQQAPPKSVTAIATGTVLIARDTPKNNGAIAKAVAAARAKAGPAAVSDAKVEAQRLAAAAGLTLGELTSVAEQAPSPYGPFVFGLDGTFGPGKYCGTIRTAIFRKTSSGRRVFTHRFRSHFGCRIPRQASVTLSATYAAQ